MVPYNNPSTALIETNQSYKQSNNTIVTPVKKPAMPKPKWHPPWKLARVISGHLGWVRYVN